jgi:microcystin-dependent protein
MAFDDVVWQQGQDYSARMDRALIAVMYDEGVMNRSCFRVTPRAAGANMSVDVSTGDGIVQGDDEVDQGNYYVRCTLGENVVIPTAPVSGARIDLIGVRVNDPNAGGNAGNNAVFVVVSGTAGTVPIVPDTPDTVLPLYLVLVSAGTSAITSDRLTDVRRNAGRRCAPGTIEWTTSPYLPSGWLWANGGQHLRADHPILWGEQAAGVTLGLGAGDGVTTFTTPNLCGRMPVALDNMGGVTAAGLVAAATSVGATGGAATVTLSVGETPVRSHTHPGPVHVHTVDHDHGGAFTAGQSDNHVHGFAGSTADAGAHLHGPSTGGAWIKQDIGGPHSVDINAGTGNTVSTIDQTSAAGTHNHTFAGVTGGMSVDHVHAFDMPPFSGSSGLAGGGPTGATADTAASAHNNMPPWYALNAIIRT